MTQIALSGVAVEFGATTLLRDVTVTIARGERWGVVGRNGSGKTTLLKVLTGALVPTRGAVSRTPGTRMAMLEQHREFDGAETIWDVAAQPFAGLLELEHSLERQAAKLGELGEKATPQLLERYDRDLERFAREGGYEMESRVAAVLQGIGFDPVAAKTDTVSRLSGGERGRLGLARQLAAPADVLLLDEPTNHLDLQTTAWLEDYLAALDETVIVVSHDRAFLERIVDHVLHVEAGSAFPYASTYSGFVQQRAERRLSQQRAFQQQQGSIRREEDYIRRNIAGQNSKQAKGRRTRLARLPRLSPPPGEEGTMGLRLKPRERGGNQVAIADKLHIAIGDRVLLRDFTNVVQRGDVLGLIGPNGAGKSTLLRTLMGEREPTSGTLRPGGSITAAYYRQDLSQVPLDSTPYEVIAGLRPEWGRGPIQAHLGTFDFPGDSVHRSTGSLSGGERARLALAMIVLSGANFLLLDEPTNHLDVESIETLEDAIKSFDGTVLVVSHDRALLTALTTRIWSLENERISDFAGSFEEWEAMRAEREADAKRASHAEAKRQVATPKSDDRKSGVRVSQSSQPSRRDAQRLVESAEAEIAELESRLGKLRGELEDGDLYGGSAEGARRASELARDIERNERALEGVMARWAEAQELVERLA